MFSIIDHATAAINVLGAIDALENALARTDTEADVILATDNERELLSIGIVNARFVVSTLGANFPQDLSLLSLCLGSSTAIPRQKALAALRELRIIEAAAEAFPDEPALAA